jgi:DNA-binding transcriptional regulator YiaG
MLEHTSEHPIREDISELRFIGPVEKRNEAVDILKHMGFVDISDSIPWRECFSKDELTPGSALTGARYKEGVTQREFSKITGIPQRHISEMENNKRSIGKEMAKKLGKALNISYKVFL